MVTSDRMLQASGVFTRKIAMMPLVKVTDMSFQRSSLGRLLGFGEFILESAGQDQALRNIDHVPYPEQLYLEICALIFRPEKIPCPQCDGQGVLIQENEDGEETTYLCPLCKGRKTVSADTLVAENRDFGDDLVARSAVCPFPGVRAAGRSGLSVRQHESAGGGACWPGPPGHTLTRAMPATASSSPASCGSRIRSPSTSRASTTVIPGYSEVSTTAIPNSPSRVATT